MKILRSISIGLAVAFAAGALAACGGSSTTKRPTVTTRAGTECTAADTLRGVGVCETPAEAAEIENRQAKEAASEKATKRSEERKEAHEVAVEGQRAIKFHELKEHEAQQQHEHEYSAAFRIGYLATCKPTKPCECVLEKAEAKGWSERQFNAEAESVSNIVIKIVEECKSA